MRAGLSLLFIICKFPKRFDSLSIPALQAISKTLNPLLSQPIDDVPCFFNAVRLEKVIFILR